ncbi:Fic family protein [Roseospira marina]|uniref:Fic family protein n=1 Tax=Roseospira marina TaxID=140057 RepID=UPI00180E414E|nr:Fic family protein [Roseospira marina]MBB4313193.1 Fic family protein [Roseospira marina]MBB5086066.1 Fic family protein [Roseospira marina]
MGDLETFLHADTPGMATLVKAGLAHVQFETIHPFLDGNGRLGRLLITLFLCERGLLRAPLLYLSLYLKTHRRQYYDLLQGVRDEGDWESWLAFFLEGVERTAEQASGTARTILRLFEADAARLTDLGRGANAPIRVHRLLQSKPLIRIPEASDRLTLSQPTVGKALDTLGALGIVEEVSGRKRGRVYVYRRYLDILNEGTEPLPR